MKRTSLILLLIFTLMLSGCSVLRYPDEGSATQIILSQPCWFSGSDKIAYLRAYYLYGGAELRINDAGTGKLLVNLRVSDSDAVTQRPIVRGGRIFCVCDYGGAMKSYDESGGGVVSLPVHNPHLISPDGHQVIHVDHCNVDVVGVYTVNSDGTCDRLLITGEAFPAGYNIKELYWEANMNYLYFLMYKYNEGLTKYYRSKPDGTEVGEVSAEAFVNVYAKDEGISPDGCSYCYTKQDSDGVYRVYLTKYVSGEYSFGGRVVGE